MDLHGSIGSISYTKEVFTDTAARMGWLDGWLFGWGACRYASRLISWLSASVKHKLTWHLLPWRKVSFQDIGVGMRSRQKRRIREKKKSLSLNIARHFQKFALTVQHDTPTRIFFSTLVYPHTFQHFKCAHLRAFSREQCLDAGPCKGMHLCPSGLFLVLTPPGAPDCFHMLSSIFRSGKQTIPQIKLLLCGHKSIKWDTLMLKTSSVIMVLSISALSGDMVPLAQI